VDADPDVDPGGHAETADASDGGADVETPAAAESSHSPPTSTAPKKISFSISSILDDNDEDEKPAVRDLDRDLRAADGATSTATSTEPSNSESDQLTTYFYRDQLLSAQSTTDQAGGCGADAVVRSWTVPPTSPFVYRESSRSPLHCHHVTIITQTSRHSLQTVQAVYLCGSVV